MPSPIVFISVDNNGLLKCYGCLTELNCLSQRRSGDIEGEQDCSELTGGYAG